MQTDPESPGKAPQDSEGEFDAPQPTTALLPLPSVKIRRKLCFSDNQPNQREFKAEYLDGSSLNRMEENPDDQLDQTANVPLLPKCGT